MMKKNFFEDEILSCFKIASLLNWEGETYASCCWPSRNYSKQATELHQMFQPIFFQINVFN